MEKYVGSGRNLAKLLLLLLLLFLLVLLLLLSSSSLLEALRFDGDLLLLLLLLSSSSLETLRFDGDLFLLLLLLNEANRFSKFLGSGSQGCEFVLRSSCWSWRMCSRRRWSRWWVSRTARFF